MFFPRDVTGPFPNSKVYGQVNISDCTEIYPLQVIKFKGLINQSATCYLNAIVQALYMTPEFRMRIYATHSQIGHQQGLHDSLVTQLFCLFSELQRGKQWAVQTRALTKCLNIDGCVPGDVRELFNKILKNLEMEMQGLPENLKISSFYRYNL